MSWFLIKEKENILLNKLEALTMSSAEDLVQDARDEQEHEKPPHTSGPRMTKLSPFKDFLPISVQCRFFYNYFFLLKKKRQWFFFEVDGCKCVVWFRWKQTKMFWNLELLNPVV